MDFLFSNVQNFAAILEIVAVLGAILAAGIYAFSGQRKKQQADDDEVASKLITNLKLTVDQQEKTIGGLTVKLDTTTRELHQMQGRNTVLEQLFNGSEGSILSFLKEAPELMRVAKENHQLALTNSAELKQLTASIEMLVKALTPKAA
jgi:hypothetical protein